MANADGVFTRDLFERFRSNCGGCHVEQAQGEPPWQVTPYTFMDRVDDALENLRSTCTDAQPGAPGYDPLCTKPYMPPPGPNGMPFDQRDPTDPIVELVNLLQAWRDADTPPDVFYPAEPADADTTGRSPYIMDRDVALAMTNIGNCVPQSSAIGSGPDANTDAADKLDKMFEAASELPDRLEQTDLVTLDARPLAAQGIIAYAPAYTLWADNAQKIRMLRVPRGKAVAFDKDAQAFTIPPNTRFYKTFLKRVIDLDGNESYRKIETRLILSRPDSIANDGSRTPHALFGTYVWNQEETEATLLRNPLRNGKPFRDELLTYVIDEKKAYDVVSAAPPNLDRELEKQGLTRTYALPGSTRCIQCHMGAPNASFILGFTPLQINRQAQKTHGVIEPAAADELNQMQRLIDYKIISGMSSPFDVKVLEDMEGDRKPRNDYELTAQAYMVGNCAHCHNPVGFPTVSAPELRDLLNFWPSKDGGIFQFPLDRFSPRVFRGDTQQTRIPYITPSLYDLGETADEQERLKSGAYADQTRFYVLAPWRSLLYRNVDSPFSYVDDSAIFPHMPRNTPGYDCRARQMFGSWMASIPAKPVDGFFANEPSEVTATATQEQPYVEVKKGDNDYDRAVSDASKRVDGFTKGPRFAECPDPAFDIIDPKIRDNADIPQPDPNQAANNLKPDDVIVANDKWSYSLPIPSRSHWFVTDTTEAPGDWFPRRADWQSVIVDKNKDLVRSDDESDTLSILDELHVTGDDELRKFALTEVPFGVWKEDGKQCSFPSSIRTVSDFKANEKPSWMRGIPGDSPAPDSAHVFNIAPGAQVFETICRSCHGPQADSKSRLADTISDLTGGETRVANLRDGLFSEANRQRVFGPVATMHAGTSTDDWTTRYIAWMTLGGTKRYIPGAVVNLISNAYVLGEPRGGYHVAPKGSGNMLETARNLCSEVSGGFGGKWFDADRGDFVTPEYSDKTDYASTLIYKNGDGIMWEHMCKLQNPLPVRVLTPYTNTEAAAGFRLALLRTMREGTQNDFDTDLFKREGYGSGPVGDQTGTVQLSLTDANTGPWCIKQPDPSDTTTKLALESHWTAVHGAGALPPYCPPGLLTQENRLSQLEITHWSKRGAMNAGLSVFLYLNALIKGQIPRVPDYDRCDQLGTQ